MEGVKLPYINILVKIFQNTFLDVHKNFHLKNDQTEDKIDFVNLLLSNHNKRGLRRIPLWYYKAKMAMKMLPRLSYIIIIILALLHDKTFVYQ